MSPSGTPRSRRSRISRAIASASSASLAYSWKATGTEEGSWETSLTAPLDRSVAMTSLAQATICGLDR